VQLQGEDPNELPVEVQHAVYSFGYSIRDLESITQWMFRLVEAKEILERLRQLEDEYEDLPLIHFLLRDTISVFDTLTGFLAARAILPDREYESLWVDVMLSGSEQNGGRMIANFQANAKEQIREIDTEGIGFEGDTLVVEEGIELTEKKLSRTHTLGRLHNALRDHSLSIP